MTYTTIPKEVVDIVRRASDGMQRAETSKAKMQIALSAICEVYDAAEPVDEDDPQKLAATYEGLFDTVVGIAEKAL